MFAEDSVFISELALDRSGILRTVLITFLKYTRKSREKRTSDGSFQIFGREFQRATSERALNRMAAFNSFAVGNNEDVSRFRIRDRKTISDATSPGPEISGKWYLPEDYRRSV